MKYLILAAIALIGLACSSHSQTIKSLGYDTTNGFVTYSGSNSLTFTNALQFSTNARAATRTNLGGTTVGNAVFTATNAAAAATAIGLGATNDPTFSNIQLGIFGGGSSWGFAGRNSGGLFELYGTNLTTTEPAFYGFSGYVNTAFSAGVARTNLGLGATNNVGFRRLKMIAADAFDDGDDATLWLDTSGTNKAATMRLSGTGGGAEKYNAYLQAGSSGLQVSAASGFRVLSGPTAGVGSVLFAVNSSGNATLNGVNNTAPSQTADSASSLMTRGLSDARFYPLASFWLPAEDMQSYNAAGTGNPEWTNIVGIANMVTPFGRAPRTVAAPDATGRSEGIYTIPTGWPAGAQVRVTTYLALFNSATTNVFNLLLGGYWTTNTNIISPVASAIGSVFSASSTLTTNVAGTGTTNEYFKISNTFSFATNANRENRQVYVGRFSTSTNDTATNTIYFIGSHVELLP